MIKTELIKTDTRSSILNEARAYDKRVREFEILAQTVKPSDLPTIFQKRIVGAGTLTDPEKLEAERRRALEAMKHWCLKSGFKEAETAQIIRDFEKKHRAEIDDSLKSGKPLDYKSFLEKCAAEIIDKRDAFINSSILPLIKLADKNLKAQKVVMYKSSKRGERSLLEGYVKIKARNDIQKALEVLYTEEFEKAIENLEAFQMAKK